MSLETKIVGTVDKLGNRFWSKVLKTDTCWLWQAGKNVNGYGLFNAKLHGKHGSRLAHRVAWALVHNIPLEDVPANLDHIDCVTSCVNPEHLNPVSHAENMQNLSAHKDSSTGVRGVCWSEDRQCYRIRVYANGREHGKSGFKDLDSAEKAVIELRSQLMTNNVKDRK